MAEKVMASIDVLPPSPQAIDSPTLETSAEAESSAPGLTGSLPEREAARKSATRQKGPGLGGLIDRFLARLSSVPFGITLLVLLIIACMIGMLIQQQELDTFGAYYNELTPAEKIVYGNLGFFDIYHVWYFNALLLLLSLNIILASIDHFPAAWSYLRRKKLSASPTFVMTQKFREEVEIPGVGREELVERASAAARTTRFRIRVTEAGERTTIFAERGVWNRLGAYAVHVGLLTIFFGGYLTSRGYTGSLPVTPDRAADRMLQNVFNVEQATSQFAVGQRQLQLPFTVRGVDIQQKLIDPAGGLDAGNTLDWLTRVEILDRESGQKTNALIHMNNPYDYRGYRLFQASYNPLGNARTLRLSAQLPNGSREEVTLTRNGEAQLSNGARLKYSDFNPHLVFSREGRPDFGSTEYENPAARLLLLDPSLGEQDFWAVTASFRNEIAAAPFLQSRLSDPPGYQFTLLEFEKVPLAHILSVQYDPGARVVYVGFTILCLTLIGVFFFSHQRLWIVIESGKVFIGGDANRNRLGFEDRARKLITLLRS
jgi:cytochrome c biogenesis protein